MKIQIRPMTMEDLPQVHAIDVASFSMPWSENSFRFELTGNPSSRVFVAEAAGEDGSKRVVGMLVIWLILGEAHVGTIAVSPDCRKQGVGQKLLAEGLLSVAEEGARTSFLEVRRSNVPAQLLYQRFGYEVVGVRPRYYKDNNEDALLLTLHELDPGVLRKLSEEKRSD